MTAMESNARKARFLIGIGDWMRALGWCLVGAAIVWIVAIIIARLTGTVVGHGIVAGCLVGAAVVGSGAWAWLHRRDLIEAAAELDRAAGLKERTSSGLYCQGQDDPFARAVVADAESLSTRLSVRSFIKPTWPPSMSWAGLAVMFAFVVPWLPISPLQSEAAATTTTDAGTVRQEVARVKKRLRRIQEQGKDSKLGDLKTELKTIDNLPIERLESRASVRKEVVKKLDHLADSVRKQLAGDQTRMKELKKMFRGLKNHQQPKTPNERLSQALAKGDFKAAERAVKDMQEKLAKLKMPEDEDARREMEQQLKKLADKMAQAAKAQQQKEQLEQDLKNAGVDEETVKKALEKLSKKDINQLKSELKKKGVDQQTIDNMATKMEAMKKAAQQSSDMAQAAQQAAEAMKSSAQDASEALQSMADQLNSMESLDQQIGELESMLSEMQDAKNDLSDSRNQCKQCQGKGQGCKSCNGSGKQGGEGQGQGQGKGQGQGQGGMGKMGQGRGGRAPVEETAVRFKKERTPVHTGKGSIISKMFVDGEQVRGDVSSEVVELITASERDATDAIDKNRIPNKYRNAIKHYFSRIHREFGDSDEAEAETEEEAE